MSADERVRYRPPADHDTRGVGMRRKVVTGLFGLVVLGAVGSVGVASAVTSATPPASQFTVFDGFLIPATGTPAPASGKHAALYRNTSYATTTISGSGRVVLGAIGSNCDGW